MANTIDDQQPEDCGSSDSHCSGVGSRLYQITEDELHDLEKIIPELFTLLGEAMNHGWVRVKIQRVKNIICDTRWQSLPWKHVERIE